MENEFESQMSEMYHQLHELMGEWMLEGGATPMPVAAVMMTTALRLYRTCLNDEDFNKMMDYLSDVRDNIDAFPTPEELRGKLN